MYREEHIKNRQTLEHTKECEYGVKERWSPMDKYIYIIQSLHAGTINSSLALVHVCGFFWEWT